jgi:hypothetical protein
MSPGVERSAKMALGAVLVAAFAPMLGVLVALLNPLPDRTQTLSIEVSGAEGQAYEITYENSEASYTEKSTVPDEYTIPITTGSYSDDYVRASVQNLGPDGRPMRRGLNKQITVNLRLVAEDGTVLAEDCTSCSRYSYVFYRGEDL